MRGLRAGQQAPILIKCIRQSGRMHATHAYKLAKLICRLLYVYEDIFDRQHKPQARKGRSQSPLSPRMANTSVPSRSVTYGGFRLSKPSRHAVQEYMQSWAQGRAVDFAEQGSGQFEQLSISTVGTVTVTTGSLGGLSELSQRAIEEYKHPSGYARGDKGLGKVETVSGELSTSGTLTSSYGGLSELSSKAVEEYLSSASFGPRASPLEYARPLADQERGGSTARSKHDRVGAAFINGLRLRERSLEAVRERHAEALG
jgi:hypothetical protein